MNADSRTPALQGSLERPPRLLVLSYNFPPDQEVGGFRWAGLTKYLARMGWECEVITQPWTGPVGVPEGVEVKRVAPLTTLRRLYRRIRGMSGRGSGTLPASASTPDTDGGANGRSKLREMAVAVLTYPDVGRGWILRAALTLRGRIRDFRPDLVVSTGPPHSVHLSALLATRGLDVAWWCDFRDPWRPVSEGERSFRGNVGWMEHIVLTRTSGCITTTPQLARALEARYPGLVAHCVLNAVDVEHLAEKRAGDGAFSVVHVGTLYGGRDPGVVLEGFSRFLKEYPEAELSNSRVDLIGPIEAQYASLKPARLADLEIEDRVNLPGPLPRPQAMEILAGASVAVVLAQEQEAQIPAKLYECLALGVPTLVVTESGSATSEVAHELGAFEVGVDDVEGVASFLGHVWQDSPGRGLTPARSVDYEGRARELAGVFGEAEGVDVHA